MTTSNSADRNPHDLNLVAGYVEHRLDKHAQALFERHLVTCTECRELLATYVRASMADAPFVVTQTRRFAAMATSGWLAFAASAVLAIGVSIYLVRPPVRARSGSTDRQQAPGAGGRLAASVPAPAVPTPAHAPALASPSLQEDLSKTRSSERHIEGKTFRLEAGAWVDTAYDPLQLLPNTDVTTPETRTALLHERPELKPFADLGPVVVVVVDGRVYRFGTR